MVSKDFIKNMLDWLSRIYDKRLDDKMVDSYHFRLKYYDEEVIRKIVFKWSDVSDKFPKIADIIAQLPKSTSIDTKYKISPHMMCNLCHKKDVMCIKEPIDTGTWTCRECYTGLTDKQIADKFRVLSEMVTPHAI